VQVCDSVIEVRFGSPGNALEVELGTVEVDIPRSVGYFGGLAVAVGVGLIEQPLALFIAAVPVFKVLTNSALPPFVRGRRKRWYCEVQMRSRVPLDVGGPRVPSHHDDVHCGTLGSSLARFAETCTCRTVAT
jgi:hypothetical protein